MDSSLTSSNRELEEFFSISYHQFARKDDGGNGGSELTPIVTADVRLLLEHLIDRRELDPDRVQVQIGLDGGQGILKVCMLVYEAVSDENGDSARKRLKHSDGVGGRQAKLTSVKRLLVIAAAPGVEETWENLKCLLEKLDISTLHPSCLLSVDIKVQLILCGKQSAASTHPCPYCECQPQFTCDCRRNTLGSLTRHYEEFIAAGGKKINAKNHNNCVNPPLLQGPSEAQVINLLTFPELHVMTGTVGHIVKQMIKMIPRAENVISRYMK